MSKRFIKFGLTRLHRRIAFFGGVVAHVAVRIAHHARMGLESNERHADGGQSGQQFDILHKSLR